MLQLRCGWTWSVETERPISKLEQMLRLLSLFGWLGVDDAGIYGWIGKEGWKGLVIVDGGHSVGCGLRRQQDML